MEHLALKEESVLKLVRVWFRKEGTAKYISHLDLNRCISRAFHKAKIPLWYTQGFNPHPFLTFALPLSLGISGIRESMDIKMEQEFSKDDFMLRLNDALPAGIKIFDVTDPIMKPGKIAYALYSIWLEPQNGIISPEAKQKIEELFGSENIIVPKRSKSGIKDINLIPYLDKTTVSEQENKILIRSILPAGSTENINPSLLIDAINKYLSYSFFVTIVREDIYDDQLCPFC